MAYHLVFSFAVGEEYQSSNLAVQLYDVNNNAVGSPITTGFHYTGGGFFMFDNPNMPDNFRGIVKVYDVDTSEVLTCSSINPQEVEYSDIKFSDANIYIVNNNTLNNGQIETGVNDQNSSIQITTGVK